MGLSPGDLLPGRTPARTPEERHAAAMTAKQRRFDLLLQRCSEMAYIYLVGLRRRMWQSLSRFEEYTSKRCCQLEYLDHALDLLQFGTQDEKMAALHWYSGLAVHRQT